MTPGRRQAGRRTGLCIVFQFVGSIVKIAAASTLVGSVLSAFDLSAADILAGIGLTPQNVLDSITHALTWAAPNLVLGSIIMVPLWLLSYMLRPPQR